MQISRKFSILFILNWIITFSITAQNSASIYHTMQNLSQMGRVLYVAAHPDDENTRVISYLTQKAGYQVAYLSLTRGDGGQNLVGSEQGPLLGLIRSLELVEARKIDGAQQFFTRAYDFGYSKKAEETMQIWNKDSVLKDMVWIIRSFKPDIIINRFPSTGEGGHGHHTASALLAEEAFSKAADPDFWPEQVALVGTWQAKRLIWNTFQFGDRNTTSEDQFKIACGAYVPLIGKSIGEVAAESRSKHASQGFGTAPNPKEFTEYFRLIKGEPLTISLMDGVDTNWSACIVSSASRKKITNIHRKLLQSFQINAPYRSLPLLFKMFDILETECNNEQLSKSQKIRLIEKKLTVQSLILSCAGIDIRLSTTRPTLVPGDSFTLSFRAVSRNPSFPIHSYTLPSLQINFTTPIVDTVLHLKLKPDWNYKLTQPYWMETPPINGLFAMQRYDKQGLAMTPNLLNTPILLQFKGRKKIFEIETHWKYRYVEPSKGEQTQEVFIAPPISITPMQQTYFYYEKDSVSQLLLPLQIKKFGQGKATHTIGIQLPSLWKASEMSQTLIFEENETEKHIVFQITKEKEAIGHTQTTSQKISFSLQSGDAATHTQIQYPHIPQQWVFSDAAIQLIALPFASEEVKRRGKIGYIEGAGDKVASTLSAMGLEVVMLQDSQLLQTAYLQQFKVIVAGVRAYNVREILKAAQTPLDTYVKNGGRLVVQYNTQNRIGPLLAQPGPYPIEISRERITDEQATPRFLLPQHPLWHTPFKIEPKHFEGWVQERGVYFAGKSSDKYLRPLGFNDPDEPIQDGGILIGNYGKGTITYTGLSFFRQLPQGHVGGITLFLNLLYHESLKE